LKVKNNVATGKDSGYYDPTVIEKHRESKMNTEQKRQAVREIINSQNGKFFTAKFVGVTGDTHVFNGRTGVFKYSKGGVNYSTGKEHLLNAFNVQKMGYRNLNLDGITEIHAGHSVYNF